jgi:Aspartyl/Asparaginyl beta-hydroxylase
MLGCDHKSGVAEGPMKLDTRVRVLGRVAHEALKQAASELPAEAWLEEDGRQKGSVYHKDTQSIMLLMARGWPDIQVERRNGWDYLAAAAVPLMEEIQTKFYPPGGVVHRAVIAKLAPGGRITPHIDSDPSFAVSHRIHVPLVTNPKVQFRIAGQPFFFEEGVAREISNLDPHSVINASAHDRLHFVFDYAPQ